MKETFTSSCEFMQLVMISHSNFVIRLNMLLFERIFQLNESVRRTIRRLLNFFALSREFLVRPVFL